MVRWGKSLATAEELRANASLSAGLSALSSQATIALINNGGDIGKALQDLGSADSIRNLATAMIAAGLTSGISGALGIGPKDAADALSRTAEQKLADYVQQQAVSSAVRTLGDVANGKDVGASLRDNLKIFVVSAISAELFKTIGDLAGADNLDLSEGSIEKIVLHATAGCAIGAAASKDCFAGALGAGLQEALSGVIDDLSADPAKRAQYAGLIASTATFLAGGDSTAIGTANQTANDAREFNRELHVWEKGINKQLAEEMAKKKGTTIEEELEVITGLTCAIVQCGAGGLTIDPDSPEYTEMIAYLRESYPDYMAAIDTARLDDKNIYYVRNKDGSVPYLWYDWVDALVDRDVPIESIPLEDFTPEGFGKKIALKGISELGEEGLKLLLVSGAWRGKNLGAAIVKEWSIKSRLKDIGLPTQGKIRFVPKENYSPSSPLRKGDHGGYFDRFGNEWIKGPSRTPGQPYEWDVRLSTQGKTQLGWISPGKDHINVSLDGKITHK